MLIVDANDPDRVRSILQNNIDCMSNRHEDVAAMYDRASSVAPAFGMVGTLVGLIKMLLNLKDSDMGSLGPSMGTALITTLYGCILAHIIFGPIASNLRGRDEEEVLCKEIVLEGVMSIQSGENPKFLRERLRSGVLCGAGLRYGGDSGGSDQNATEPKGFRYGFSRPLYGHGADHHLVRQYSGAYHLWAHRLQSAGPGRGRGFVQGDRFRGRDVHSIRREP